MLLLVVFVFYITCFVSAQSSSLLPPFLNSTSSVGNTTTSTLYSNGLSATGISSTFSTSSTTSIELPSPTPSSTSLSCPESNNTLYTAPSGQDFVIECSIDHFRGDLSSLSVPDLETCIAACDSNPECIDVSLSGSQSQSSSALLITS